MSMSRRCSSLHFTNIFIEKLEIVFGGVPILRITSAEIIQLICSLCLRRPIPLMNAKPKRMSWVISKPRHHMMQPTFFWISPRPGPWALLQPMGKKVSRKRTESACLVLLAVPPGYQVWMCLDMLTGKSQCSASISVEVWQYSGPGRPFQSSSATILCRAWQMRAQLLQISECILGWPKLIIWVAKLIKSIVLLTVLPG